MTVKELFDFIKGVRPGFAFTDAQLTVWLNEIEGHVQTDIWLLEPAVDETQTGLVEYDSSIDPETGEMVDANHELLVPFPWNKLYRYFLLMSIDLANGEYQRYANSYELFNEAYEEYAGWYAQHVSPANGEAITRGYYISAYQFAARGGYAGTEEEFYETLGGIGTMEARIIEQVDAEIEDLTEEINLRLGSSTVYNVQNYEIMPDTGEDLYYKLFDLLHNTVHLTGGIVYFPVGEYRIGNTILIPANTVFLGEGKNTIIKFTERLTSLGVALTNGGDNVGIVNMTVDCNNNNLIVPGALTGSVGFGTFDFESQTDYDMYASAYSHRSMKNVFAEKLYTNTRYLLQTETGDDGYTITDVLYRDIYAEKSLVSVMARATIDNVIIDNVTCAFLRLGTSNNTCHLGASCKNIRTGRLWAKTDDNHLIDISDISIVPSLKYDNDMSDAPDPERYAEASRKGAVTLQGHVNITNADFNCGEYLYGIARYKGKMSFTNMSCYNYTSRGMPGVLGWSEESVRDNIFVNCEFIDGQGVTRSAISGKVYRSNIDSSGQILDGLPPASNIASFMSMNLNDYTEQGVYCCHANTVIDDIINGPIANVPFYLRVIRLDYLYGVVQIFSNVSDAEYLYIRHGVYNSGTNSFSFGAWYAFQGSAITP